MFDFAYASTGVGLPPDQLPAVDDPGGWASALYTFIRSGAHLPAVGAALVMITWAARMGLGKLSPWFTKPIGGYVVGFGTSALLYVGTALASGAAITWGLVGSAIAAAYVAAGGWEHLRDLITKLKQPPPPAVKVATTALVIALCVPLISSCATTGAALKAGGHEAVECGKVDIWQTVKDTGLAAVVGAAVALAADASASTLEKQGHSALDELQAKLEPKVFGCAVKTAAAVYETATAHGFEGAAPVNFASAAQLGSSYLEQHGYSFR